MLSRTLSHPSCVLVLLVCRNAFASNINSCKHLSVLIVYSIGEINEDLEIDDDLTVAERIKKYIKSDLVLHRYGFYLFCFIM